MSFDQVFAQLEEMGTAQNRKVYARHGIKGSMFGVSYANLGKLKKQIKKDHSLAVQLWGSGNHDARILATMIADPSALDNSTLEAWSEDLDSYPIADALSGLVARSSLARERMEEWTLAESEWTGMAGWNLLSHLAIGGADLDDEYFLGYLDRIQRDIHQSKNRVRYSMNNALISIGGRSEELRRKAGRIAERIGQVDVDHGQTGCKTPDAGPYIEKMWARKKARAAK